MPVCYRDSDCEELAQKSGSGRVAEENLQFPACHASSDPGRHRTSRALPTDNWPRDLPTLATQGPAKQSCVVPSFSPLLKVAFRVSITRDIQSREDNWNQQRSLCKKCRSRWEQQHRAARNPLGGASAIWLCAPAKAALIQASQCLGSEDAPNTGALINHADRLTRLDKLRRQLIKEAAQDPRAPLEARSKHGATQEAVIKVLTACAPEPMATKDIKAAVELIVREPVSPDTIYSCLSVGMRRRPARFVRTKRGWYRLA
jgi:hypothetical protein